MRDFGQVIPTPGTESDTGLTPDFTYDELKMALLDEASGGHFELLEASDITVQDWMDKFDVVRSTAADQMRRFAKAHPKEWKFLTVYERPFGKRLRVLRKIGL